MLSEPVEETSLVAAEMSPIESYFSKSGQTSRKSRLVLVIVEDEEVWQKNSNRP